MTSFNQNHIENSNGSLMKTRIYLLTLAGFIGVMGLIILLFAFMWSGGDLPGSKSALLIFLGAIGIPIIWVMVLSRVGRALNIVSLIFPLGLLFLTSWIIGSEIVGMDLIEAIIYVVSIPLIGLIVSFVGIFLVLSDTFNFNKKSHLILASTLIFLVVFFIVTSFYFDRAGGGLTDLLS